MSEEAAPDHHTSRLQRYRFVIMLATVVAIALFLVSVALALYVSSGAAQLDLSRPGYVSVRKEATESSSSFDSFPATGSIDQKTLEQFQKTYDTQAEKATKVDSFGGSAMSDQTLSLDAPSE